MTDREAAPSATPSWLRPLGPDPDLSDVAWRAAVVGRMAGRVSALASDLQLLAMLLQDAAQGGWSASSLETPATREASQTTPSAGGRKESTFAPIAAESPLARTHRQGRAQRAGERAGAVDVDDPFARAEAAVGALRAAFRPAGGAPDGAAHGPD